MSDTIQDLDSDAARRASRLIGVGASSGAVVLGLSAVRRTGKLALLFVDASVSANTQRELSRLERQGAQLFRCADILDLLQPLGRDDVSVVGVKSGPLAQGVLTALASS